MIILNFNIDPLTATVTFLPCGCVEYPQLGIIAMGEIKSKHDLKIMHDLLADENYINN